MKQDEMTKQFERIWDDYHDPDIQRRKKQKELKEERQREVAVDLGIE